MKRSLIKKYVQWLLKSNQTEAKHSQLFIELGLSEISTIFRSLKMLLTTTTTATTTTTTATATTTMEVVKGLFRCLRINIIIFCCQFHQHFMRALAPILLRKKQFKPKM
jgi:hypothetical protein